MKTKSTTDFTFSLKFFSFVLTVDSLFATDSVPSSILFCFYHDDRCYSCWTWKYYSFIRFRWKMLWGKRRWWWWWWWRILNIASSAPLCICNEHLNEQMKNESINIWKIDFMWIFFLCFFFSFLNVRSNWLNSILRLLSLLLLLSTSIQISLLIRCFHHF